MSDLSINVICRSGHLSVPDAFTLIRAIPNPFRNSASRHWLRIRFPDTSWRAKAHKKENTVRKKRQKSVATTAPFLICSVPDSVRPADAVPLSESSHQAWYPVSFAQLDIPASRPLPFDIRNMFSFFWKAPRHILHSVPYWWRVQTSHPLPVDVLSYNHRKPSWQLFPMLFKEFSVVHGSFVLNNSIFRPSIVHKVFFHHIDFLKPFFIYLDGSQHPVAFFYTLCSRSR